MVKKIEGEQNKNSLASINGFTYAELVICLLIIAIVVGPICASFASANRVRATSEALNDSITHTEALMEAVKAQLTEDVKLKKQKEGNQILAYPATPPVTTGITLCLDAAYDPSGAAIGKAPLNEFLVGEHAGDLTKLYETDRYAYEIAIWRTGNIDLSAIAGTNTLEFTGSTLDRAAKFYSDSAYQFSSYATSSANIKFEINNDVFKKVFKKQSSTPLAGYSVLDQHSIVLTTGNLGTAETLGNTEGLKSKSSKGNQIIINKPVLIKRTDGKIDSLIYTATTSGAMVADAINIIDVDVRQLLRKANLAVNGLENNPDYDGLTLKFINDTDQNQVVRLIRNASEGIDTLEAVDKKINVVAIDNKSGKTSIQRIEDPVDSENFIIAIVARDMKPVIGNPGKVVKKMIDIYSYETGND